MNRLPLPFACLLALTQPLLSNSALAQPVGATPQLDTTSVRRTGRLHEGRAILEGVYDGRVVRFIEGRVVFILAQGSTFDDIQPLLDSLGVELYRQTDISHEVLGELRGGAFYAAPRSHFYRALGLLNDSPHVESATPSILLRLSGIESPPEGGSDPSSNGLPPPNTPAPGLIDREGEPPIAPAEVDR